MKKSKKKTTTVLRFPTTPREILADSTGRVHAHMSSADIEARRAVEQLKLNQANAAVIRLTMELKQASELVKDVTAVIAGLDSVLNIRG